ncbi:MAG: hypothetical protein R2867_35025 [Caldilineaceae bacterium]
MPQHAFGAAYYALKAIAAADSAQAEVAVAQEQAWQVQQISPKLRPEVVKRVVVEQRAKGLFITVPKDKDF